MPGIKTPKGHFLGAKPSEPNPNYNGFPSHLVARPAAFPPSAWLTVNGKTGKVGRTKNQGAQGSCTAHGGTSQGETLYLNHKGTAIRFAPAFHYYLERKEEGTLDQGDCGAQVVTSLQIADLAVDATGGFGYCPETLMPYNENDISTPPSPAALAAAKLNPGGAYHQIGNNIANIKSCILSGYTLVLGIAVYDSFESDNAERTGLIPYPNLGVEQLLGGHEVHSGIGYDDRIMCPGAKNPGAVLTQNSWDVTWGIKCPNPDVSGDGGFCWISYDYLLSPLLTSDVWMQHLGHSWESGVSKL